MRKIFVLILVLFICYNYSFAQENIKDKALEASTFYGKHPHKFCFYGTIWGGGGRINGYNRFLCGGNIAWLAGPSLGIGLAYTACKEFRWWQSGGLLIEPIVKPKYWVHVSFPTVLGFGYGHETGKGESNSLAYMSQNNGFLYGETAVQLEFNPWKYMRLDLGVKVCGAMGFNNYYDYVYKDQMDGYSFFLAMKFGRFL